MQLFFKTLYLRAIVGGILLGSHLAYGQPGTPRDEKKDSPVASVQQQPSAPFTIIKSPQITQPQMTHPVFEASHVSSVAVASADAKETHTTKDGFPLPYVTPEEAKSLAQEWQFFVKDY